MKKQYIIYKITNVINGKFYVGKHETTDINDDYMGSGRLIISAIKKYGIDSFKKEILHIYDSYEEATNKEKEIVDINFIKNKDSYNLRIGGDGGNTNILKTDSEIREIYKKFIFLNLKIIH
jgi:hypothetical protein